MSGPARAAGHHRLLVVALGLASAATAAALVAVVTAEFSGSVGVRFVALGVAAVGVLAVTAYRPIVATYVYLATLPFLAGIERGALVPLVRPNEALLVLLLAGAAAGGYLRLLDGRPVPIRPQAADVPLVVFVVLATVWPITSMLLRGVEPGAADLAAVLPVCKLTAVLLLVRLTIVTDTQVRRVLAIVVSTAAAVALIAVLQTLRVGPVVDLLGEFWNAKTTSFDDEVRGSTTLAHPIATGDYIVIGSVLLVIGLLKRVLGGPHWLLLGAILAGGLLAAGQFSSWLAAAVAGGLVLARFPQARRHLVRIVPFAPVVAVLGAPAVAGRLATFQDGHLPVSWQVRWNNVTHFYLPEMGWPGVLFGVSPNSVLEAPETWREAIYLEAGYVQFLWIGGLPLLLAFLWLSREILRQARRGADAAGAAAACCASLEVIWWIVLVLTVLDPHLFLRGVGDLLFTLIAISFGSARVRTSSLPSPPRPGSVVAADH